MPTPCINEGQAANTEPSGGLSVTSRIQVYPRRKGDLEDRARTAWFLSAWNDAVFGRICCHFTLDSAYCSSTLMAPKLIPAQSGTNCHTSFDSRYHSTLCARPVATISRMASFSAKRLGLHSTCIRKKGRVKPTDHRSDPDQFHMLALT